MPYLVDPTPNQLSMLRYAPGLETCTGCGRALDKWAGKGDLFTRPRGGPPLSRTREGHLIASPKFVDRYVREGWKGLSFRRLSNGYDEVQATRCVRLRRVDLDGFDMDAFLAWRAEHGLPDGLVLRYEGLCSFCGLYGASCPVGDLEIVRGEVPLGANEFVASNIECGSCEVPRVGELWPVDSFAPYLIAGDAIRASHLKEKIRLVGMSEKVGCEVWAAVPGGPPEFPGRVVPFPCDKRPPPEQKRRGSIRNPRRPDDLRSWLRDITNLSGDEPPGES